MSNEETIVAMIASCPPSKSILIIIAEFRHSLAGRVRDRDINLTSRNVKVLIKPLKNGVSPLLH